MALVENKQSQAMEEKEDQEKNEIYYRVFPEMKRQINYQDKSIKFEIALPGVKKENIELKALPTWFYLSGKRGHMEYAANQSFGVEIVPEKTEAKYEEGLLHITAHIRDPMDDAKQVEL